MAGFIRRYLSDPGIEELLAIEGAVIIDREPPASITGVGTGCVLLVGEFDDGCFNEPTEVMSGSDLVNQFGSLGFAYGGVEGNNPSARVRRADSAIVDEYWNGNGWIALVNKKFRRLVICRVDTTVGEVTWTRLASVVGNQNFNWDLEPGWYLEFDLNGVSSSAAVATLNSSAGTSPQTMLGGETLVVTIDAGTPLEQSVTLTATAGSLTQAAAIQALNNLFGDVLVSNAGSGVTRIVSRVKGTDGNVTITSASVLFDTLLGFTTADTAAGTGTSPAWAVFNAEAAIMTSSTGTYPAAPANGDSLTLTIDEGTDRQIGPIVVSFLATDTSQASIIDRINVAVGYTAVVDSGSGVSTITGRIQGTGGNITITQISTSISTATGFTTGSVAGTGNVSNINQVTFAEAKAVIEAADTNLKVERNLSNYIRVANEVTTGTTRTIQVTGGTAVSAFGFDTTDIGDAFSGTDVSIPAGARVQNSSSTEWVVARSVDVVLTTPGSYVTRIRPALDNGTVGAATAGTVTVVPEPIGDDAWSVVNLNPISAALTETQIDAAYVAAFDKTLNPNTVSREVNIIVSARQSNAIRQKARENALSASANGLYGRMAVVSPPLKTTRSVARSNTAQPGVGAYRDQRVVYAYPGVQTYVGAIASRGTDGGIGFTADGYIDTHFDVWVASTMSQLAPEENPGQSTTFMSLITAIEAGNTDVQDMREADYRAFKKAGIAAPRIAEGVPIIQSGKTSVNPDVNPNLQNINRRRMADFIQDTLAIRLNSFSKKLSTRVRRASIIGEVEAFMIGLRSPNNETSQRIESYSIDSVSGNTPEILAAGLFRIILKVRTLPSLDVIVLDTEIGESVVTVQAA